MTETPHYGYREKTFPVLTKWPEGHSYRHEDRLIFNILSLSQQILLSLTWFQQGLIKECLIQYNSDWTEPLKRLFERDLHASLDHNVQKLEIWEREYFLIPKEIHTGLCLALVVVTLLQHFDLLRPFILDNPQYDLWSKLNEKDNTWRAIRCSKNPNDYFS